MCCLVVLALGATAVIGARTPPLTTHTFTYTQEPTEEWGLSSINMDELWEQFTVKTEEPPVIEDVHLMGSVNPVDLIGKHMKTIKERPIYAFQGIMYGEAMVGELRFKRTIKKEPYWGNETELHLNNLGKKCSQMSMILHLPVGSEDCLNLNVYTPYLPDDLPEDNLLPVMFFVHGGGFVIGDSSIYLPTKLLDHDVILVVIHYRLGNFGFYSLDNDDAPGNAALWDQITALQWVQENIEVFGGDKDRVTIFGESSGSASVNYLMLLPEAKGLFHGVIGQSGSALENWAHNPDPIGMAEDIGAAIDCPINDHKKLYECMRDKTAREITMSLMFQDLKNGLVVAPVTQGPAVSEPLLTDLPVNYLTSSNFSDVPLMIGSNKHEGSFVLATAYISSLEPNGKLNDSVYLKDNMMVDLLKSFGVEDFTGALSEIMMDDFLAELDRGNFTDSAPGYIDAAGVLALKAGGWQTARLHAKHGTADTFHYTFDFESNDTMSFFVSKGLTDMPFRLGVTHGAELPYLLVPGKMKGEQLVVMDRMTKMWTNFAKYGDPTPDEEQGWKNLDIEKWRPLSVQEHPYMLIQDECTVEKEFPKRWHIALQEDGNLPWKPTLKEYNELLDERDAYFICMVVFIVAFFLAAIGAVALKVKK